METENVFISERFDANGEVVFGIVYGDGDSKCVHLKRSEVMAIKNHLAKILDTEK